MNHSDFVRQLPGSTNSLSRPVSVWQRLHIDPVLMLLLLILTGAGLFILYSASGRSIDVVLRQGRFFLIGYVAMLVMAQFDLEQIKRLAPLAYVLGLVLLILVPFFGVGAKGAQRWLSFAGFRFQPAEIMKLVLPMVVAWYFSLRVLPPRFKYVVVSVLMIFAPVILIGLQPDLGTAILIGSSGLFVLFFAGISWRLIFSAVALMGLSAYPLWHYVLHDYQRQRILTMLDPETDKLGAGWNIIQSKTAIGSGGFYGKGWLHGTQSQLDFLPESHTDFIIAVLGEEGGLRAVLLLLFMYLLVITRGFWIGLHAQHCFGRLLAGSITLTFFVYVFVNIGMVSGLLPVVGVPLPLVSQGGTAIVTLMLGFGLLMAISTEKRVIGQ